MIDKRDAHNLLAILNRSSFKGLDEAEVAMVLKQKLVEIAEAKDVPRETPPSLPGEFEDA